MLWDLEHYTLPSKDRKELERQLGIPKGIYVSAEIRMSTSMQDRTREPEPATLILNKHEAAWFGRYF